MKNKLDFLTQNFLIPFIVLIGILFYLLLAFAKIPYLPLAVIIPTVILGSYQLFRDSYYQLLKHQYALDYIAIVAIIVSIITGDYLVSAVLALMIASGRTLEEYGAARARASLTKLIDRIPKEVYLRVNNDVGRKAAIEDIDVGQEIFVRRGEVVPLDGTLVSEKGYIDESSLTGEAFPVEKIQTDEIRSGTVNTGNPIILRVTQEEKNSTYTKIIRLVQDAEKEKAPLIRLADQYSTVFSIIAVLIAGFAYYYSHSLEGILAVLVVATPCPLILATPIALMGGINAAAKKWIIVKNLGSLEKLSRVNAIMFDKTGTITLGHPKVKHITIFDKRYDEESILAIAEAIERNSLHPLAKAIIAYANQWDIKTLHAQNIEEVIGEGISGEIDGEVYALAQVESQRTSDMAIALSLENHIIAVFAFEDQIKEDSRTVIKQLTEMGLHISIFTGDKIEVANRVAEKLGGEITVVAECTPEDKQEGIKKLKKAHKITAMVGDGINDAPALALADVGMVFSNEEQTAASEAADIVFLHSDFSLVSYTIAISRRTIRIAMQSILFGIGLSIVAMVFAAFGLIPPLLGAVLQEVIDVIVILNALRASK